MRQDIITRPITTRPITTRPVVTEHSLDDDDETTWDIGEGTELIPGYFAWDLLGLGRRFEMWIAWCRDRLTPVCIKVPRRDQLDRATINALGREAKAASSMSHPAIPRVFALDLEAPVPYLVYEFIEGKPLSHVLEDDGAYDANDVVLLGLQLAAVLRHVHGRGFVHLDVKPSNVTMRNDRAILLDFDIALPIGGRRSRSRPRGTPAYMAPEQIQCEPAHPSMDLFALGTVLYEAATSIRPFDPIDIASSTGEESDRLPIFRQLTYPIPPLGGAAPHLPPPLVGVIERLMAFAPADRPESAAAVIRSLQAALPAGSEGLWPPWVVDEVLGR